MGMLAFQNVRNEAVSIDPECIESVEAIYDKPQECVICTVGGREHYIARSHAYVTGVLRSHYNPSPVQIAAFVRSEETADATL